MTAPEQDPTMPDPGVGVLAVYLDRALAADPAGYQHPGKPSLLWPHAASVLAEVEKARAEYRALDDQLEDTAGGLL